MYPDSLCGELYKRFDDFQQKLIKGKELTKSKENFIVRKDVSVTVILRARRTTIPSECMSVN